MYVADHLVGLPDVAAHDVHHVPVEPPPLGPPHDRYPETLLVQLARVGSEAPSADVDHVRCRGEEADEGPGLVAVRAAGPVRAVLEEHRSGHGDVVEVAGALPRVVGEVHIAGAHALGPDLVDEVAQGGSHGVDVARRPGDGLGDHAALRVEHSRREVAGLPHRRRERGPHQGQGLLFDHGDQAVPHDLHGDLVLGAEGRPAQGRVTGVLSGSRDPEGQVGLDHRGVPGSDHRRGLVLDDQGRAGHGVTGRKFGALVQGGSRHDSRDRVVDGPGAGGSPGTGCGEILHQFRRGALRRHPHRPAHRLDGEALDGPAEEGLVGLDERRGQLLSGDLVEVAVGQRHRDLPALAPVAHEYFAFNGHRFGGAHPHERLGFRGQFFEHPPDAFGVEAVGRGVEAAGGLVGERGEQEPDSRADPSADRHQNLVYAQLVDEAAGVQRCGPAEGDHRVAGQILAALHRMGPGRVGHVLVYDLRHAHRGGVVVEAEGLAHAAAQGPSG